MRTTLGSPGSPWPFAAWDSVEGAFRCAREKKKNWAHVKRFHFGENENSKVDIFANWRKKKECPHLSFAENQKFCNCDLKLTKLLKYCLFIVFICLLISTVYTERPLNEQIHSSLTIHVPSWSINSPEIESIDPRPTQSSPHVNLQYHNWLGNCSGVRLLKTTLF